MNIPKIVFKIMPLEDNIDSIKWMYFDKNEDIGVHDLTVKLFPKLASIDESKSKEKIYEIIEEVVTKEYKNYIDIIKSETDRYNKLWAEYNDKYFEELSNFLGVNFPEEVKEIEATVGLIPVFPRYLDSFSFSVSINVPDYFLIKTCAHETLHFLWFEKWKKLYPGTPRRHFDAPYIEWKYSEMVTDPILNNEPFYTLFNFEERGYDSFYDLYDGEELVMDKLRKLYSTNNDIDRKIEDGLSYIKKYFKLNDKQK